MLKKILTLCAGISILANAAETKFIHAGQKLPTDAGIIATNIRQIEQATPYDGMVFPLNTVIRFSNGQQKNFSSHFTSSGKIPIASIPYLNKEQLQPWVNIVKNIPFQKFTHNFLSVNTNCIGKNWFDDKAWEKVTHNYRMLAWAAKEANLKGIVFDIEQYRADSQYLCYDPALGYSFEDTARQVRLRGKQLIEAMGKEFPEMQFFAFMWQMKFGNKDIYRNFKRYRESDAYGLLPAFINGVYDGILPGIKIIEGNESFGYRANSYRDIDQLCASYRLLGSQLIAPENQTKYRTNGELAIGFFLDAYANCSVPGWNKELPSPARSLALNLRYAAERTDRYVWCWEEKGSWVSADLLTPKPQNTIPHWEKLLPEVTAAINYARAPVQFAKQQNSPNLLKNGNFSKMGKGSSFPGFSLWKLPQGTVTYDQMTGCGQSGSVKFDAVPLGCLMQKVNVKPGEIYLLEGAARRQGNILSPQLIVYWRDKAGKWAYRNENLTFSFDDAEKGGWSKTTGIIEIPALPQGTTMWILLQVTSGGTRAFKRSPVSSRDIVWFDDISLRKILLPGENRKTDNRQ